MKENNIPRRDFLKKLGFGIAATTIATTGCDNKKNPVVKEHIANGELPKGKMTYRTNPNTGDKVSLLGYGCMRWPTFTDEEGKSTGEIDQEAVNRLVDKAIEYGVNYFDTAPVYCRGKSEYATGVALKRHPRDKYFIATKLSNFNKKTHSREGAMEMYRNSFKELQVDYIDYLLLHSLGGGGIENYENRYVKNGMIDFLMEERKAGRIRNLGFSYHGDKEMFDYLMSLHDTIHWDFVQIQLNYVDWHHSRGVSAEYQYMELEKRGIPVVIMEPLLGGRLSKVHDHVAEKLKRRSPESSIASWAFRFAGTWPGVLNVLSGMTHMEHLDDNIRTYSPLKPLSDEEKEFLEETAQMMQKYPTIPCNDCQYCMPCPYGLDIPAILLHYNKCINEGTMPASSQDPKYREARRAFLVGYDRSVPKLRQADHCIGCRKCVPLCPQKIKIHREMERINQFVETLKQNKEF